MTFGPDGTKWTQTTGIGIGLYVSVCPTEDDKEPCPNKEDPDPLGIDGFSGSWKMLIGGTIEDDGDVCFLIGPMISIPGAEWDITPQE